MCFKKKEKTICDLPCRCEFCEHAAIINDDDNILCDIKGIAEKCGKCKKYVYDPLKRIPKRLPDLPKLTEDDII